MAKLKETSQIGKREHILDIISMVDAKETPFVSMAGKAFVPQNTLVEWSVDNYPTPRLEGALETDDAKTFENAEENKAMLYGRIHITERKPMVGRLAQNVSDVAGQGKGKAMAKAVAKMLVAAKRDIESRCLSDKDSQAENGETPYGTRGMGEWLKATAQTDLPVPADYRTPTSSITTTATASMTEADVNNLLASNWEQTGKQDTLTLFCGMTLKRRFAGFTQTQFASTNVAASVRMFTDTLEARKITNVVDIYEGDGGTLELILDPFLARDNATAATRNARGYAVDMDLVQLGFHTAPRNKPLPDGGGGPRSLIEAIWCLCYLNPLKGIKFAAAS
jgi:hypothetical protein